MQTVVQTVQKAPPKRPEPQSKLLISASETEGGKHIKALHQVYQTINGKKVFVNNCLSYSHAVCSRSIAPGNYELNSTYNEYKVITPFTVTAGKNTKLNVVMGQTGKVKIIAVEKEGGKRIKVNHNIYHVTGEGEKKHAAISVFYEEDKSYTEKLPIGNYELVSAYNRFKVVTPFTVSADTITELTVVMGQTGKVEIAAFETEGGKQVKASHAIYQPIDEEEEKHIGSCNSYKEKACKERLPVGEYFLISRYNEFKIKTPFTVTAGQTTNLNVIMGQTGKVQITAFETEGGKQVKAGHSIYQPIDEDENKLIENCRSYKTEACKERLPVGEYFLVSEYNQFEVKTLFTITAGQTTNLNVIMGQTGKVEITAFETEGGKQVKAYHEIYQPIDEDENKLIENCRSYKTETCEERLPVGNYFVKSRYGDVELETPLTITAGQITQLTIDFSRTPKPIDKQALIDADKETSQNIQPANKVTDTSAGTANAESVNASAEQSADVANDTAINTANKGAATAVAGALSKMVGGAKPSAEQSDATTANPSAGNLQPQAKQGSTNDSEEPTPSGDKTAAQAKAVMGLIQAFGDKEDVQTTKKALQAIRRRVKHLQTGGDHRLAVYAGGTQLLSGQ